MRRFDEASPMLGRAATLFRELGNRRMEGNTQLYLALLELARGDFEPALARTRRRHKSSSPR
jgi:hypothetical protein